jgi:hypothetical protein
MRLEGELMYLITEQLSPPEPKRRRYDDDDFDGEGQIRI